ncbi:hypothetical protein HanIR_Chr00c28g0911581 [Helianthus annuus]|nr:hypothetical protein HanIR_Chr00c28g0911581 [Helianthus annuus]
MAVILSSNITQKYLTRLTTHSKPKTSNPMNFSNNNNSKVFILVISSSSSSYIV